MDTEITSRFYENMIEMATKPTVAKAVLNVLATGHHVGKENAIRRVDLVSQVWSNVMYAGHVPIEPDCEGDFMVVTSAFDENQLVWSYEDRVVRKTISELQLAGVPILSNSRSGGYFIAYSHIEVEDYLLEIQHRIDKLRLKVEKLRSAMLATTIGVGVPVTK